MCLRQAISIEWNSKHQNGSLLCMQRWGQFNGMPAELCHERRKQNTPNNFHIMLYLALILGLNHVI